MLALDKWTTLNLEVFPRDCASIGYVHCLACENFLTIFFKLLYLMAAPHFVVIIIIIITILLHIVSWY